MEGYTEKDMKKINSNIRNVCSVFVVNFFILIIITIIIIIIIIIITIIIIIIMIITQKS